MAQLTTTIDWPLTGGPTVVDRWSGGGLAVVHGGLPLLTVVDRWSGCGSGDGTGDSWQATWHHSGGDTWPSND
ncbi:hypothetical protein Tco_1400306 [Tanacetum coccineum]